MSSFPLTTHEAACSCRVLNDSRRRRRFHDRGSTTSPSLSLSPLCKKEEEKEEEGLDFCQVARPCRTGIQNSRESMRKNRVRRLRKDIVVKEGDDPDYTTSVRHEYILNPGIKRGDRPLAAAAI